MNDANGVRFFRLFRQVSVVSPAKLEPGYFSRLGFLVLKPFILACFPLFFLCGYFGSFPVLASVSVLKRTQNPLLFFTFLFRFFSDSCVCWVSRNGVCVFSRTPLQS